MFGKKKLKKIVLDYYHAFTGTLDVNVTVLIVNAETGETKDRSENYEWLASVADLAGAFR